MSQLYNLNSLQRYKTSTIWTMSLLLGFFAWRLWTGYWSDSEIWSLHSAQQCSGRVHDVALCWSKPFFYPFLNTISIFSSKLENAILIARIPIWLAWAFAIWAYVRSEKSFTLLLTFLTSSIFMLDSAYIRSDFLALPFLIAHLALLKEKAFRPFVKTSLLVVTAALAILMTPKAGLWLLCFTPFYVSRSPKKAAAYALSCLLLLVLIFCKTPDLLHYAQNTFNESSFGLSLWSLHRFDFFLRALIENPHFTIAFVYLLAQKLKDKTFYKSSEAQSFGLLTLLLVVYPEKLPFWLSCHLFLMIFIFQSDAEKSLNFPKSLRIGLVLFSALFFARWWWTSLDFSSSFQRRVVNELEKTTEAYPYLKVYDSTGLLFKKDIQAPFLGPSEDLQVVKQVAENIKNHKYDLILVTKKVSLIRPVIFPDLLNNYCQLSEDIWVRAESDNLDSLEPHLNAVTSLESCQLASGKTVSTVFMPFQNEILVGTSFAELFQFEPSQKWRWKSSW